MNYCIQQQVSDFVQRTILRFGNLAQRSFVGRLMRQAQSLIQDMRRHVIRVGDIADVHPPVDRLILVIVPVDCRPHRANDKKHRD